MNYDFFSDWHQCCFVIVNWPYNYDLAEILDSLLIVIANPGWFLFVLPVGSITEVENMGLSPQVHQENDFFKLVWIFHQYYVDECEVVPASN